MAWMVGIQSGVSLSIMDKQLISMLEIITNQNISQPPFLKAMRTQRIKKANLECNEKDGLDFLIMKSVRRKQVVLEVYIIIMA